MKSRHWFYKLLTVVCVFACLGVPYAQMVPNLEASPLVLRVSFMGPSTGTTSMFLQKALNEAEQVTEGRIKAEVYWSESLMKTKDTLRGIQKGICSMGFIGAAYFPAELPLTNSHGYILYAPKGNDTSWMARKAWEFLDRSKDISDEFQKWGQTVWMVFPYDSYCLFTNKKIVKTCEDFKGLRIKISAEGQAKMVNAIGGNPVFLTTGDTYAALQKRTIDGYMIGWETAKRYSLHEVTEYIAETDAFLMFGFITVSLQDLDRMSKKDKESFLEVGRRFSVQLGEALNDERNSIKIFMEKRGINITPFPNEEKIKWAKTPQVQGLIKNWIDEQNAAGRPGTKVMETLLNTFEIPK